MPDTPLHAHDNIPAELAEALARYRDLPAMSDGAHALSYGELAGFVGHVLGRIDGSGPVAVFGLPGTLMAASVVAAVIGGRPFVHLDPAMPQAVLANIVDELGIDLILCCDTPRNGQLPGHCRVIRAADCLVPGQGALPVAARVDPQDAIYLVATSGTTGRPKCIPVTQDSAWLSYRWRDAFTPYDTGSRVGIYIFAIWELLRPLRHGGQLFFPDLNDLMSPRGLRDFLDRNRIDEMLFTPSFFEKTLGAMQPQDSASLPLRRVILNGEVVPERLVAEARAKLPRAQLWNLYSICETHDISMTRLQPGVDAGVGRAMPHLRAIVLDEADRPCPPDEPGLLHFEGPRMLGPGYVNRPEETAQRFRHVELNGEVLRLYDTGDRGFVTADGQIHVLGRVAHMLKLRGHSIQTRELTETLGQQMEFARAIPWVQQQGGDQVLLLYYTADDAQAGRNCDRWQIGDGWQRMPDALARRLAGILPRYCVPSFLVRLDEIPINKVSGKCDFKALPLPPDHLDGAEDAGDLVDAARIAARILGHPPAGFDAGRSFHDHGGDSLMCVDFLLSLEQAYGRRVDFDWALNLPLMRLHELLTDRTVARAVTDFTRRGILLTGATGFLGGHVLAQAARELPADQVVYCLVRPRNRAPEARLAERAAALGVAPDRFVALEGSIDQPCFGLDPASHSELAAKVDHVIHCAATVNLAVAPEQMEEWSRAGIRTVLSFCREAGAGLSFSSSNSVFPDRGGPYPEGPVAPVGDISGYGVAKIAAEHAIAASGVAATILRLPSLYDLDAPNPKDIYELILAACRECGGFPEGMRFSMTDVTAAARALVARPAGQGARYANLMADHPVCLPSEGGMPLDAWLQMAPLDDALRNLLRASPDTVRADARYDNAAARLLWDKLGGGDFSRLSDPRQLLARRLGRDMAYQSDPALT
ncbi:AMP-binding protein [Paracoccus sp. 1_MG-2023]|uniref:AMP-binding protein n=1 Tax=unclassified Paracoccus (in: a-proteobacteria) TaxID=2688777 RepID=UPI001C081E1F|nr:MULTISPECIES: AMP-binding protein [unclassified Paracoccus (in: a-proteobacteria)]MBU2957710.1 AMP-binding protein [Paracoccus sp. C2R09]MDO6667442.1 AMP-binding protein [Paracoccus sp. 1_MG-2023]